MASTMPLGFNLRNDLAKISDAELATRLDQTINELEATKPTFGLWMIFPGARGPLRHPWFYKLHLLLGGVPWWKRSIWPNEGGTGRHHLLECELQDLRDELQRRVQTRRARRLSS
jgi:hypothetical protein